MARLLFKDHQEVSKKEPVPATPVWAAPPVTISPPPVGQLVAPPVTAPVASAPPVGFGPPPIGSFQTPSAPVPAYAPPPSFAKPAVVQSVSPASKPAPSKPSDSVSGMPLAEMVDLAKQVRGLGDMQGALEVLKRADLQYPASPEVMSETAQCYEQMGLTEKASALWKQLASMDAVRSAGFGDLAKRKMQSGGGAETSSATLSGDLTPKVLSLGACQASRDPSVANGEKVILRVPILRQGNSVVDPAQVDIDVYFFDRVNGEKVAQTIADEPVSTWGALPVDWSGAGEEPLDVAYFLPALTPGEIAAHGRRSYHGYVVRLYYQHKLQDVSAEPRDLLDFGSSSAPTVPGGVNPLLPPLTN
ncbi:MAG: tetratricopeptide repeat protein [Verrucomicrobia bacterium]|nr:tetratricopeptide repeat protein [Verrucomicrobiota bacterium]